MPFTRVELCLFGLAGEGLQVLLARREAETAKGAWALPGGVLRIDLDADLDAAAQRVALERLGTPLPYLRQQGAVGGADRDPRGWALSIVYRGLLPQDAPQLQPGKRIGELRWADADAAAADRKLAFDHAALIGTALAQLRQEVEQLEIPFACLPPAFTLAELQAFCERVLGRRLDKSSFRRKVDERGVLEAIEGEFRTGANRPAQLYRKAGAA